MSATSDSSRRSRGIIVAVLAVALIVLHQDYWLWNDGNLVWGIFPMGLFWHICISIAATLTWFLATRIVWPFDDANEDLPADSNAGESGGQV